MFKLVEESMGLGELSRGETMLHRVTYRIHRFQGTLGEGGLPVPGLYRIEGQLVFDEAGSLPDIAGSSLTLRLDDGRSMEVTVLPDGRFRSEGRHARGCSCC